jgi:hypothetical protein
MFTVELLPKETQKVYLQINPTSDSENVNLNLYALCPEKTIEVELTDETSEKMFIEHECVHCPLYSGTLDKKSTLSYAEKIRYHFVSIKWDEINLEKEIDPPKEYDCYFDKLYYAVITALQDKSDEELCCAASLMIPEIKANFPLHRALQESGISDRIRKKISVILAIHLATRQDVKRILDSVPWCTGYTSDNCKLERSVPRYTKITLPKHAWYSCLHITIPKACTRKCYGLLDARSERKLKGMRITNVFSDATICWGTMYPPTMLSEASELFFSLPFNADIRHEENKVTKYIDLNANNLLQYPVFGEDQVARNKALKEYVFEDGSKVSRCPIPYPLYDYHQHLFGCNVAQTELTAYYLDYKDYSDISDVSKQRLQTAQEKHLCLENVNEPLNVIVTGNEDVCLRGLVLYRLERTSKVNILWLLEYPKQNTKTKAIKLPTIDSPLSKGEIVYVDLEELREATGCFYSPIYEDILTSAENVEEEDDDDYDEDYDEENDDDEDDDDDDDEDDDAYFEE